METEMKKTLATSHRFREWVAAAVVVIATIELEIVCVSVARIAAEVAVD